MGSLRALPTWMVADCKSVPIAWLTSRMACVASSKVVPLISLKVARTFVAPRMASSLNSDIPLAALRSLAKPAISSAVNPAAMPVDSMTAWVWAKTLWNSCASLMLSPTKSPSMDSPLPTALMAASPMRRSAPVAISPRMSKPPPAFFAALSKLPTAPWASSLAWMTLDASP